MTISTNTKTIKSSDTECVALTTQFLKSNLHLLYTCYLNKESGCTDINVNLLCILTFKKVCKSNLSQVLTFKYYDHSNIWITYITHLFPKMHLKTNNINKNTFS